MPPNILYNNIPIKNHHSFNNNDIYNLFEDLSNKYINYNFKDFKLKMGSILNNLNEPMYILYYNYIPIAIIHLFKLIQEFSTILDKMNN